MRSLYLYQTNQLPKLFLGSQVLKHLPLTPVDKVDWDPVEQENIYTHIGEFKKEYSRKETKYSWKHIVKQTYEQRYHERQSIPLTKITTLYNVTGFSYSPNSLALETFSAVPKEWANGVWLLWQVKYTFELNTRILLNQEQILSSEDMETISFTPYMSKRVKEIEVPFKELIFQLKLHNANMS